MTKYDNRNDTSDTRKICEVHCRTMVYNRFCHRLCILIFSQRLCQSNDEAKLMQYRSYVILRRYLRRYIFRGIRSNAPMENANPDAKDANSTELKGTYKNIHTKRLLLHNLWVWMFAKWIQNISLWYVGQTKGELRLGIQDLDKELPL